MDILRLRIEAFGRLRDLDTGPDPLPRMVVLHGPNESGKSTFFAFLASLLYGFYPATRDGHPYAPWGGGDAEGEARIRTGDGEVWEVRRRLLSSPTGTLVRGTERRELRNRTLPQAGHVPRKVFEQVFALTRRELGALGGESWARVQDRLVTGMGASDLRSVRDVVAELEREAGRLWRPNRRGSQEVRELRQRRRELRGRRREAVDTDRRLRESTRERDEARRRLRAAREERERLRLAEARHRELLPARRALERIAELEAGAGDPERLADLPPDPRAAGSELREVVDAGTRRLEELATERSALEERIRGLAPGMARLLEREEEVRGWLERAAALEGESVRAARTEQEIRDLDRRLERVSTELLGVAWSEMDPADLRGVSPGEVRRAARALDEAREERKVEERTARLTDSADPAGAAPLLRLGLILAAGGLVGAVAAIVRTPALGLPSAALLAAGVALGGAGWLARRRSAASTKEAEARLRGAAEAVDRARERLEEVLAGVPVRQGMVEEAPGQIAGGLERLQELLRDRADREAALATFRERRERLARELGSLARKLDRELPPDPGAAAHLLPRELEAAREAATEARAARRELERVEAAARRAEEEVAGARGRLGELERRLAELGGGDAEEGAREAARRRGDLEAARRMRLELEREHGDLDALQARAGSGNAPEVESDDAVARRRARLQELDEEVESLTRTVEGLGKDLSYLAERETVDEVDGELAAVEEAIAAAVLRRDRLQVVAALLRDAERRFRDEHQPDVLRRAGEHLATITEGRYERILLDEEAGTFHLQGPGYPGPVPVAEPVSTGTREQVYLSVRLAILDHLDREGERLPLFMDEAFAHWDAGRRDRGLSLLEEVSRTRQVFLFTCHEPLVRELRSRGARELGLGTPLGDEARAPAAP